MFVLPDYSCRALCTFVYIILLFTLLIRLILNNSKGKRERSGKYFAVKTLEMHRLVSRSGWMALDPNTSRA